MRTIGIMRVSVCLGAILIPEYLDFHSGCILIPEYPKRVKLKGGKEKAPSLLLTHLHCYPGYAQYIQQG